MSAGRLQRARKTPTTMTSEMTIGERPIVTSFVGASAAPSQAPAVSPERMPRSCREREREERFVSSAVVAMDDMKDKPSESTRAGAGLRWERLVGPKTGRRRKRWRIDCAAVEMCRSRWSRVPFPRSVVWVRGQDTRDLEERHDSGARRIWWHAARTPARSPYRASQRYEGEASYFLKRFSKAWRASSGREGGASAMAACCAGCE